MSDPTKHGDSVIRIGRQEALGPHVDDLLARQRSLSGAGQRGPRGRGRWYYRNWFVFMIAGGVGAFAAWGLLEPYFGDLVYYQGEIDVVDWSARLPYVIESGNRYFETGGGIGALVIRGERVWLTGGVRMRAPGGWGALDEASVTEGREVGVYVEYFGLPGEDYAIAMFLVPDPPPQGSSKAKLTLAQLHGQSVAAGVVLFGVVAGLIGLAIGAVDGVMCRLPRRAIASGAIGLVVGFIGAFMADNLAEFIYSPLSQAALQQTDETGSLTTFGFLIQMLGRSMAWACAGMAMGLGQGIALRSKRLLLYGFLGGIIGGLLGGLLFDPIDLLLLDPVRPSAHWSRLAGFVIIGMTVGAMIGIVELLARDAWLRMVEGPLAGKEFLIFKDLMRMGAAPSSEIYLFNDPLVAEHHANLRMVGDDAEIENIAEQHPVEVNGRAVTTARLRHGDQVVIGGTAFVFEKRRP